MRVLVLATDIYTRGGIGRYTATLATALGQLLGAANVDVLPLLDDSGRRFIPANYQILDATTAALTSAQKVRHMARALKRSGAGYDVVVCSHVALAPIAALIRLRHRIPYLVVCHGSEAWERLPSWKRFALDQANAVLAVSRFTAEAVAVANGVPPAKIKVLPNAIPDGLVRWLLGPDRDPSGRCANEELVSAEGPKGRSNTALGEAQGQRDQPRSSSPERANQHLWPAPLGLEETLERTVNSARWPGLTWSAPSGLRRSSSAPRRAPALLSVGSLRSEHGYKGVDTVIEALPRIAEAVPGAHYVVVGDGDNRAALEQFAMKRSVSGQVTFAGEVTDAQLAEHYRACDIFVLPSRASRRRGRRDGCTEGEGFGRVYVEAALAGKPVVGSRDGGAAEAVLDGRTGLLVDPRSPNEIAEAVIGLLRAPERAMAMGAKGRRWALENFTVEAMRRSVAEILLSVAPCPPSSRSPVFSFESCSQVFNRRWKTDDRELKTHSLL